MSANETLNDMFATIETSLATANDTLARMKSLRNAHIVAMGGTVAMPSSPVLPPPSPVVPITQPAVTGPFPGEGTAPVRQALRDAAHLANINPAVLEAIEVWETGHYRDPNAKAWLIGNNPGGMKSSSVTAALGQVGTEGPYAAFPTWEAGIRAHGGFLKQSRYDAARATGADVATQVHAIWAAGYSEMDPDWLANVTAIALKLEPVYASGTVTPTDTSSEVTRARSATGKGILYSEDTSGGTGGDDPTAPLPGYHHPNGSITCDCSLFLAWSKRYRRADRWDTEAICADARGAQTAFMLVQPGSAQVGDLYCYHIGDTGHCGYISQVSNGTPTAVVHCHSGNTPALQETDCSIFTIHSALIVRYHGPQVG